MSISKMISSLPLELYNLIVRQLQLHHMINLTVVSRQIRKATLSEYNWYTISDTSDILYSFINKIFKCQSTAYPYDKIESMYTADNHDLLRINISTQQRFAKFYDHFPNYQCLDFSMHIFDGENERYEQYIMQLIDIYSLKISKLKLRHAHLNISFSVDITPIINNLSREIETLIINSSEIPLIHHLHLFKNLHYLMLYHVYETKLNIDTLHIVCDHLTDQYNIFVPNVKNIIISKPSYRNRPVSKMHISSEIAESCRIIGMVINEITFDLPKLKTSAPIIMNNSDHQTIFGERTIGERTIYDKKIEWIK